MNTYVTGSTIRQLRETKHLTQAELAAKLSVSAKTISKWETAKGLPDISLLEPLAAALGVSVLELMQGEPVVNQNRAANLLRSKLYVCPLCGKALTRTEKSCVCPAGHSFDLAKEGYCHLLPANRKHSKAPGDDKDMAAARSAFLSKGYYAPLRDAAG